MQYLKSGQGQVPPLPSLFQAAKKQLLEHLSEGDKINYTGTFAQRLEFTAGGLTPEEAKAFLNDVLEAGRSLEPIIESGNKYGVSDQFHDMNAELQKLTLEHSAMFRSLSPTNQERAKGIFEAVFGDRDLRNRNCLHPGMIDSWVIGNLINFPKHIFGFPFACHGTDGNEILSLLLFSYRQACKTSDPVVIYVVQPNEDTHSLSDIQLCAERLNMKFHALPLSELPASADIAVVMTNFESPDVEHVSRWAEDNGITMHIHLRDRQWRNVFALNKGPVHFNLPAGIRSISIEEGLFNNGFAVYRDTSVRDRHLDLGYEWQTAYMSPNEGGSGASAPLFADFCLILMGWTALCEVARQGPLRDPSQHRLVPVDVQAGQAVTPISDSFDGVLKWAKTSVTPGSTVPRSALVEQLVCFQRDFIGGKERALEAMTSGGGTRSINLAFESVLAKANKNGITKVKVLTGNPHLAVERAERRFQFELVRLDVDGALNVDLLRGAVTDPEVLAVYAQTLSYTDGTTDPLNEIMQVIEQENATRPAERHITLINDCCLAFCVLLHNSGTDGSQSMRVLDMNLNGVTPCIVTIDAHKHLGTDKGISTVVGTQGTLSVLAGHVKVGAQPGQADLVRALGNMHLVGRDRYVQLYHELGARVARAVEVIEGIGMTIVHKNNRVVGSTVIAVEDPSGTLARKIKKRGHSVATLFSLCPRVPARCQNGWQLSLTPYALRDVDGGKKALDVFLADMGECYEEAQRSTKLQLSRRFFRENSLLGHLMSGNLDGFIFERLRSQGRGREITTGIIRRFLTAQLDSGTACSNKRKNPLKTVARLVLILLVTAILALKRNVLLRKFREFSARFRALK